MSNLGRIRLGDVVTHARSTVKPDAIQADGRYVLLEHIVAGTGEVRPAFAGNSDIRSSKAAFRPGDVLYGKLRPKLRKVCVAEWSGYCSTDILPLRPRETNSSHYLALVLRSEHFYSEVENLIAGANLPRVNVKELLEVEIPWVESEQMHKIDELARIASELRVDVADIGRQVTLFENSLWEG